MEKPKQGFLVRFVLGISLAPIAAFLMLFGVLPLPARITILVIGIALVGTAAVPWRAKKSQGKLK